MRLDDIRPQVMATLVEDMGSHDVTGSLIPEERWAEAIVRVNEPAVLCGVPWFESVFDCLGGAVSCEWLITEGQWLEAGQVVVKCRGPARKVLAGERTALNWLQTLSGTATVVRRYAELLKGTKTQLLDTRKTIPGLRVAQKYAVRCGGGKNHRMGLFDAYLIKENHIACAGSITAAIQAARVQRPDLLLEVEVENLSEFQEAWGQSPDVIMLDDFSIEDIRVAVELNQGRVKLEVSGSVDEARLSQLARLGVDYISVGALTKHVHATDYSMRVIVE